MSKRIQERAKDRAAAARRRERNTRRRAERSAAEHDYRLARLHHSSAELHAHAADAAEALIELDQNVEGDQLDESPPRTSSRG